MKELLNGCGKSKSKYMFLFKNTMISTTIKETTMLVEARDQYTICFCKKLNNYTLQLTTVFALKQRFM